MGKVHGVCVSTEKGTAKRNIGQGEFIVNFGIKGDAHAGDWHRQVSLLSLEKINAFRAKGAQVEDGAFGENLIVEGIDFRTLPVGTILCCADVVLEMTQIGKECHDHCAIYYSVGECIMPREGVFAKVLSGGIIKNGDEMYVKESDAAVNGGEPRPKHAAGLQGSAGNAAPSVQYQAALITVSDKGSRGEREDKSGPLIQKIAEDASFKVIKSIILPDEQELLEKEMRQLCDEPPGSSHVDLILTIGGTGFSPRDRTPEATLAVAERLVPGIAEVMRQKSSAVTGRAMLSRAVSVIRKKTLIINLPGSPKAAKENFEFVAGELKHGLDILTENDGECGS